MDHLLHELPEIKDQEDLSDDPESRTSPTTRLSPGDSTEAANDQTPLLDRHAPRFGQLPRYSQGELASTSGTYRTNTDTSRPAKINDPTRPLAGLNALEIAAVANAKRFLSQRLVQKVVQDIWDGNIIFWESLSVNAVKKARVYNKR